MPELVNVNRTQLFELQRAMYDLSSASWRKQSVPDYWQEWQRLTVQFRGLVEAVVPPSACPCRPDWPDDVRRLAGAMTLGNDCAFALADALLDAGCPELAGHFREGQHSAGCWGLHVLLAERDDVTLPARALKRIPNRHYRPPVSLPHHKE